VQLELRDSDFAGRYGGDEIVIGFVHTNVNDALVVVERIRERVCARAIRTRESLISVTGSFGLSVSTPGTRDMDALLDQADQALYAAKAAGRNCSRIYRKNDAQENGLNKAC
jgi:diguanylate cyclase